MLFVYLQVSKTENCAFETYSPAGKAVTIKNIKAPVANVESKGIFTPSIYMQLFDVPLVPL